MLAHKEKKKRKTSFRLFHEPCPAVAAISHRKINSVNVNSGFSSTQPYSDEKRKTQKTNGRWRRRNNKRMSPTTFTMFAIYLVRNESSFSSFLPQLGWKKREGGICSSRDKNVTAVRNSTTIIWSSSSSLLFSINLCISKTTLFVSSFAMWLLYFRRVGNHGVTRRKKNCKRMLCSASVDAPMPTKSYSFFLGTDAQASLWMATIPHSFVVVFSKFKDNSKSIENEKCSISFFLFYFLFALWCLAVECVETGDKYY